MANTWDRTYDPSGAISRTLGGGSIMGQSPSQNYADFGPGAGMYSSDTADVWGGNFAQMLGTRPSTRDFFDDSQTRSMNVQQPDTGANSLNIRQWGTQNPNMPGAMALDPTWAGGLRGAGMGAETTMGDVIVEGTKPGMQDFIDEGYIDSGNWKTYDHPPVVEATHQGPEAVPSCPQGYTFDPALNACVASIHSVNLSGLDPEQKMNLLSNPKMMELYIQNKNAMTSGEFVARPRPGLLPRESETPEQREGGTR